MAIADVVRPTEPAVFTLKSGPFWKSFDLFRRQKPKQLEAILPEGCIGRLNVQGTEFVIVRSSTFNQVYGLARDVSRLSQGLLLVRMAAKVITHIGSNDEEGVRVVADLIKNLTFQIPNLPTESAPAQEMALSETERAEISDDDLDFDLAPRTSTHPSFADAE